MIEEILKRNEAFVSEKGYEAFTAGKTPRMQVAVVTCMDTRLVGLLEAALGLSQGDVKMIKNAGGLVTDPWDSAMKSILVAVYELGVKEVMIIPHTNCGVEGMEGREMLHLMQERGVARERLDLIERCGIDLEKWLTGFTDLEQSLRESVALVAGHPLLPPGISVRGFVIDTVTGRLREVK